MFNINYGVFSFYKPFFPRYQQKSMKKISASFTTKLALIVPRKLFEITIKSVLLQVFVIA